MERSRMIIPVIWHSQQESDLVPAWGSKIPPAFPAQSPFAAKLQQEVLDAWRVLCENEAHLLHLDAIGPECLHLQDESRIHLVLAGPMEIRQIWPLVHEVLVLPLEGGLTESWLPVDLNWTGYGEVRTSSRGTWLRRLSAAEKMDQLVRAGGCDLHLHTTASDGTDTPQELFARIKANRLSSFAVTDHDLLDSLDTMIDLVQASCRNSDDPYCPVFVPGVEISVSEGRELHILGYFPNGGHHQLNDFLTQQRQARHERNTAMVLQLQRLGYDITLPDLIDKGQGVVGRMQAALLLTERGYTRSTQEAFEHVLGFGKPGYIERPRPNLAQAVWQIRQAGGVPVLAHPAVYHWCGERAIVDEKLVKKLKDAKSKGLLGVEAFHGEASREACLEISAAARYLGLVRTCGSDDHGTNKKHTTLYHKDTHFLAGREILVVGALIRRNENRWLVLEDYPGLAAPQDSSHAHFLLARRATTGHGLGKWELPGGKVEVGENPRDALRREIREEMGLDTEVGPLAELLTHDYDGFRIILACFGVRLLEGPLQMTAHDQMIWATAHEALHLDVLAADVALFEELARQDR
ncbi:MAG: NUDIX domain-containing protein [Clostridia bacterium]|nr:NUDIX domain-containing protein [Clostridia bacterium]